MNRFLKYSLIIGIMVLCLGYLVYAGERSISSSENVVCSNLRISIVDSEEKKLISNEEIAAVLKEKGLNPIGKKIGKINSKSIEDVVEKHPMVRNLRKPMPTSLNYTAYVPVFSGNVTRKLAVGSIFDFATFLNKNEFWGNQIEQVNITNDMKVELVPRVGDHIIMLGTFDRFEQKLEKLRKFYLYGLNEIGWNYYSKIDLQYRDQVVCTRKE